MVYQLINNGDVPDEDYFNDALMKQAVIVCTSGTRPSSPPEGMLIYETDTDLYKSYNGTGWVTIGQTVTGTYTPSLTVASGTNPTLGSGSTAQGRYTLFGGNWCTVRGTVAFGSSGANPGSGQYLISLPFQASNSITAGVPFCGAGVMRDASTPALAQATAYIGANATTLALLAKDATVTNSAPWTWANTDYMSFDITYELA